MKRGKTDEPSTPLTAKPGHIKVLCSVCGGFQPHEFLKVPEGMEITCQTCLTMVFYADIIHRGQRRYIYPPMNRLIEEYTRERAISILLAAQKPKEDHDA